MERAARDAYGRLLASLAFRVRDIAAAEDALGEALREALERWPIDGIPRVPEAWLTTVAKNRLNQAARHRAVTDDPRSVAVVETLVAALEGPPGIDADARLNMMFVCAHPAIDPALRTPLMLQTVLGLDARRIADAFVVASTTMGQRLVRAKQKIRDARIPFDPPEARELPERLGAVLEGIYAAFGTSWNDGLEGAGHELAGEALFLARLLTTLLPDEPEPLGLLALLELSHARRAARYDAAGRFVPLRDHDVAQWDRAAILEADTWLLRASTMRRPGPFQLEAAIQSAHCQRLFSGQTPWNAIAFLYEALNRSAATTASRVAHAAALVELGRKGDAEAQLAACDASTTQNYAPFWVVTAHVARLGGDSAAQRAALDRAIALTRDPAVRAYLSQ